MPTAVHCWSDMWSHVVRGHIYNLFVIMHVFSSIINDGSLSHRYIKMCSHWIWYIYIYIYICMTLCVHFLVLHHGEYERQNPKSPDEMYVCVVYVTGCWVPYSSKCKVL